MSDPDDDVLTALLCDPFTLFGEAAREAAALSEVRAVPNPDTEPGDE